MNQITVQPARRASRRRGAALISAFIILTILGVAATSYIGIATQTYRTAFRQAMEVQTEPLCEAGSQTLEYNIWSPFAQAQNFTLLDAQCANSSVAQPTAAVNGTIANVGNYSAGVISYSSPDTYTRVVVIRTVGWIDQNKNSKLDANEPAKTVDVTVTYSLLRSGVFDYTYFINNFGWWDGFPATSTFINGDMRANGDFKISNGSPTLNGALYAAQNQLLDPPVAGLINQPPVKMDNPTYSTMQAADSRMRPVYNAANMGAYGSTTYNQWSSYLFDTSGQLVNNQVQGSVLGSSTGYYSWQETSYSSNPPEQLVDSSPTGQVIMPNLNDISYYENLSQTYTDTTQSYADGTTNPLYGQGAYVQVWSSSAGKYVTVSTNGVVTGSTALIGSAQHPILIHGPVTITQDTVITGVVSGQGTVYSGRNVHVVGSITYANPPNFEGSNLTSMTAQNQKADMLALCANGSAIFGDTSQFSGEEFQYMTPPFTNGYYDESGTYHGAWNCFDTDSTGKYLYQSTFGDSYIHSISSGVNQVDAVIYTNNCVGGDQGTGGQGFVLNGSVIGKWDAEVVWSLPLKFNYDTRVRERSLNQTQIISIDLPRSPSVTQSAWQDRGFVYYQ
jgi:hypothetical protein